MADFTMSDAKRVLVATGAALLLSLACVTAALCPATAAPLPASAAKLVLL